MRQIARTLGVARNTVRRFLRAEGSPERQPRRPRPTLLTPYEPYLRERWAAGCRNAAVLWREVCARGFRGGYSGVASRLAGWRERPDAAALPTARPARRFSVREATWLLLRGPEDLDPHERAFLTALEQRCPETARAGSLARDFQALVRQRDSAALADCVARADNADVPELHSFANGLRRDWAAVTTGIELPWSSGQTEGQVNRLKLLKRQLYGRASFALLRHRFLLAA